MSCNQQIIGYSNLSASEACRNYYINPQQISMDGFLGDNSNLVLNKIIYQDNLCSVQSPSGYYSNGFVVRFYTTNNLNKASNCGKTTLFKYCCDGRLFYLNNIDQYYPGGLPVGLSLYLSVSNEVNQFNGCFETVNEEGNYEIYNIVELLGGLYTNCQTCLNVNKPTCLLSAGTYEFKSCLSEDVKYFNITTDYLFYQGAVVEYSGTCYSLISASTLPGEPSYSSITYSNCSDTNCLPKPTSVPLTSLYVKSCCNDTLYQLSSGIERPIGNVYSLPPSDFCYSVIQQPSVLPSNLSILNDTNFILVDNCNSVGCQKCPENQQLTGQTANECEPITIFPLGLKCNVVNPTIQNPFGGILSLNITGGTSPYTVVWNPGGTGETIYNQPSGTYVATVTDYWNDFTDSITCTLDGPLVCEFSGSITTFVPTPTPTSTPCVYSVWEISTLSPCTFELYDCDNNVYDTVTFTGAGTYYVCSVYQPQSTGICSLAPTIPIVGTCTPPPTPTPTPTPVPGCVTYQIINPSSVIQYPVTYTNCYYENETYLINGSETYTFCAIENTVVCVLSPTQMGSCIPPTTTTTTTAAPTTTTTTTSPCFRITVNNLTDEPKTILLRNCKNGIPNQSETINPVPVGQTAFCVGTYQTPVPAGLIVNIGGPCLQ